MSHHKIRWAEAGVDRIKELGYANVFLWVLKDNLNARSFYKRQSFLSDGTDREITRGKQAY